MAEEGLSRPCDNPGCSPHTDIHQGGWELGCQPCSSAHCVCVMVSAALCCADPAVKAFGITVDTKMAVVQARVLNPPLLAYGQPQALTPGTRVSLGPVC